MFYLNFLYNKMRKEKFYKLFYFLYYKYVLNV